MGGNKVAPPTQKQPGAAGGAGRTYTGGNKASAAGNGSSSGYGQGGAVKKTIGG